jgi:hypothetical protein
VLPPTANKTNVDTVVIYFVFLRIIGGNFSEKTGRTEYLIKGVWECSIR